MNDPIALLYEIKNLMELKGENPFKIRAFDKAALSLAGQIDLPERAKLGTLREIPGIGKGIEDVLQEYLIKGHSTVRD
ncbi:MAG: DNA polymerase/3'-5' exonuclease PolX, partial [Bdellovibrionia bacterium]